jgi:TRAP-type C4-dicarboxylate transport system permease small subunit
MAKRRKLTYKAKILLYLAGALVLLIFAIGLIQSSYMVYFDSSYRKTYVITTKLKLLGWMPAVMGLCLLPMMFDFLRRARRVYRNEQKRRRRLARERRRRRLKQRSGIS